MHIHGRPLVFLLALAVSVLLLLVPFMLRLGMLAFLGLLLALLNPSHAPQPSSRICLLPALDEASQVSLCSPRGGCEGAALSWREEPREQLPFPHIEEMLTVAH